MTTARGQAAFEYLLMIAGCVLMAATVIMIVQGAMNTTNTALSESVNDYLQVMHCIGKDCPVTPSACPTEAACSAPQKEMQLPKAISV